MQIVNNQTINVVTEDNISVSSVKTEVAKESIIPNLRTLYKNQLWPELTCTTLKRHEIFKRKSISLSLQFQIYHLVYQNLGITDMQ